MASMHHPAESDQIAASRDDEVVLGVDTHKDLHVAAVLTPVGALLASATFPTTADGYAHLLAWACEHGTGYGGLLWPHRGGLTWLHHTAPLVAHLSWSWVLHVATTPAGLGPHEAALVGPYRTAIATEPSVGPVSRAPAPTAPP